MKNVLPLLLLLTIFPASGYAILTKMQKHLVLCVKKITVKYFLNETQLLVSLPGRRVYVNEKHYFANDTYFSNEDVEITRSILSTLNELMPVLIIENSAENRRPDFVGIARKSIILFSPEMEENNYTVLYRHLHNKVRYTMLNSLSTLQISMI